MKQNTRKNKKEAKRKEKIPNAKQEQTNRKETKGPSTKKKQRITLTQALKKRRRVNEQAVRGSKSNKTHEIVTATTRYTRNGQSGRRAYILHPPRNENQNA